MTEEPSNSPALLGHAEFEELTALFEDFDLLEFLGEVSEDAEAIGLCLQPFKKISQADLPVLHINVSLSLQVVTDTIASDLIDDMRIKSV